MYTSTKSFTLTCPAGETGTPYTAVVTYNSIISQADADNTAMAQAMAQAYEWLVCSFPPGPPPTIYLSVVVIATASADPGFQPRVFSVSLPAGYAYSLNSQAEANAAAQAAAQAAANLARDTGQIPIFSNRQQVWVGACSGGYVPYSVTITIPPATFTSNLSQADADNAALASAEAQVNALLTTNCAVVYYSTQQTYTATCTGGNVGTPVTVTNPAGAYSSVVSQAAADALSLAAATTAATTAISCAAGYWNTSQTVTVTCVGVNGPNWVGANSSFTQPANTYYSVVSLAAANALAVSAATTTATNNLVCRFTGGLQP